MALKGLPKKPLGPACVQWPFCHRPTVSKHWGRTIWEHDLIIGRNQTHELSTPRFITYSSWSVFSWSISRALHLR